MTTDATVEPEMFFSALSDADPPMRCAAVEAVCAVSENPLERILPMINDPDPSVRMVTATAIGELGEPSSASLLSPLLSDADETVQSAAAEAAALLGDSSGEGVLLSRLESTSADAEQIYLSLGHLRSSAAIQTLRKRVSGVFLPSRTKAAAAVALYACTDGDEGRGEIDRLLDAKKADARLAVFSALCRLPVAGLCDAVLRAAAHRDEMVLSSAVQTLGALASADSDAVRALRSLRAGFDAELATELDEVLATVEKMSR